MTQAEVLSIVLLFAVVSILLCVGILHTTLTNRIEFLEYELRDFKRKKDGAE